MVNGTRRRPVPPGPLLAASCPDPDDIMPDAVRTAVARWLNATFLDAADDATLTAELVAFHAAAHPIAFHPLSVGRSVRLVRHALNHLVRGQDPLPDRLTRCLTRGEAYFVPGLGPPPIQ